MSHAPHKIFGYVHSSRRQGPGVTVQEEMILARARTLEGRWVDCRRDERIAALDMPWNERPGFKSLMQELEPGDHLILRRLDLDPSPLGTVAALEWLVDRGVYVHVLDHAGLQLDLDEEAGRVLTAILGEFAHLLLNYRREAARQSIRWRKERGLAYNRFPELGKRRRYMPK